MTHVCLVTGKRLRRGTGAKGARRLAQHYSVAMLVLTVSHIGD